MNSKLAFPRRGSLRTAVTATLLGALALVACFGDKTDPGIHGGSAKGGSAGEGEGAEGGDDRGGSAGTATGGGDLGGEGGNDTGGTGGGTSGRGGSGGRGGGAGMGGRGGEMGAMCGDGVEDMGEECDDGDTLDDFDCSWNCTLGCAECHREQCSLIEEDVLVASLGPCYEDDTLVEGGPAAGVATRAEVCRALVSCVHKTGCGDIDGARFLDPCYCDADFASCLDPATAVPGPCKAEVEEAAETTIPADVFVTFSELARATGRAYYVLNYCDNQLCRDQCFDNSGGMGGMSGMGGMGGLGGAGMAGGGMAGVAGGGMGGAGGMAGAAGMTAMCGDGMVAGMEDCEPPGTLTCSYRCRDLATEACAACETEVGCSTLSCDAATGTNSSGKPRRELCYEVLECLYATGCAAERAEECFCGSVPNSECQNLAPGTAMGDCARVMEAGFETTRASDVLINFGTLTYGGAHAIQRILCDQENCNPVCFE